MDVAIVQRAAIVVLGIFARIDPAKADWGDLWGRQFAAREGEVAALASEPGHYAVYTCSGEPGLVAFTAGMAVRPLERVPEGLVLTAVPAGSYARFRCTMASISQTWGQVDEWLAHSGYQREESRPDLEYYAPNSGEPDAAVVILVPVVGGSDDPLRPGVVVEP